MNYFITPDLSSITGGNKYDKKILNYLKKIGFKITNIYPTNSSVLTFNFLNTINGLPKRSTLIIDGLLASKMYCLMNTIVRKYRVILLIHHPVSYENNKFGVISLKLKERMIFSKAHGLITVSKTMRKVIQKMLNNRKTIDVIQPGIDDIYLRNNQHEPKNYNLICVGSIIPRKNIESCIRALIHLDDKWKLLIVGKYENDDNYFLNINEIISQLGLTNRVKFLGVINKHSDLFQTLIDSRIYMCMSHYEGYGIANVEAGALGLPLVVSDLPVFHENLKGFKRRYVNKNNYLEIAKAVNDLSRDTTQNKNSSLLSWDDVGFKFKRVLNG